MPCVFTLLCFTQCTNQQDKAQEEKCKGPITVKLFYPNPKDSSSYTKISYYCSGDTSGKCTYKNNKLINYAYWFASGKKSEEGNIICTIETPYTGKDSSIIAMIEDIGIIKYWNENGILIYETKLLPNRREVKIKRDSLGNVLSVDTISY